MLRIALAMVVGLAAATVELQPGSTGGNGPSLSLTAAAQAQTVNGVARRTARRTTRRVDARTAPVYAAPRVYAALPGGCARVRINNVWVYNCRGVYYQPATGGYIIITP